MSIGVANLSGIALQGKEANRPGFQRAARKVTAAGTMARISKKIFAAKKELKNIGFGNSVPCTLQSHARSGDA